MELTAKNLQKKMNIDGRMISPIDRLQEMLDHGPSYKATWEVKHFNLTKLTNFIVVRDSIGNLVFKIYIAKPKYTQYWIIVKLLDWGFYMNLD